MVLGLRSIDGAYNDLKPVVKPLSQRTEWNLIMTRKCAQRVNAMQDVSYRETYERAKALAISTGWVTNSLLQRKLLIGYGTVTRVVTALQKGRVVKAIPGSERKACLIAPSSSARSHEKKPSNPLQREVVKAHVGIFWVINDRIVGRLQDIEESQCDSLGFIDATFEHVAVWSEVISEITANELRHQPYDDVLRGRIVYDTKHKRYIGYSDLKELTRPLREKVGTWAGIPRDRISWRSDAHYTLERGARYDLLDDED